MKKIQIEHAWPNTRFCVAEFTPYRGIAVESWHDLEPIASRFMLSSSVEGTDLVAIFKAPRDFDPKPLVLMGQLSIALPTRTKLVWSAKSGTSPSSLPDGYYYAMVENTDNEDVVFLVAWA